jgi:hypothetical protein
MGPTAFASGTMAEGYFETFFREEKRLGMGASGSVYLCQVSVHADPVCCLLTLVHSMSLMGTHLVCYLICHRRGLNSQGRVLKQVVSQ